MGQQCRRSDGVGDEVATVMAEARAGLVEAGAVVDEVRLPLSVARAAAAAVVLPELAAARREPPPASA
ncbi:MAG TPA: hypothetical protein VNK73_04350 [Actinomycetota bacterium]|jgi:hypothetical protein|nr:hypothetical protein [Actinomycetota bacterium]